MISNLTLSREFAKSHCLHRSLNLLNSHAGVERPLRTAPFLPMSIHEIAANLHAHHLRRAEDALKLSPPRLDIFWLHSRICDAIALTLAELKELPQGKPLLVLSEQPKEEPHDS